MANLIIGHTTETTARVWVRGSRWRRRCEITLDPADARARRIRLSSANDYCGVVEFDRSTPGRRYAVTASFSLLNAGFPGLNRSVSGCVRTIQRPEDGKRLRFSFVLSSCNLSIAASTISCWRWCWRLAAPRWRPVHSGGCRSNAGGGRVCAGCGRSGNGGRRRSRCGSSPGLSRR